MTSPPGTDLVGERAASFSLVHAAFHPRGEFSRTRTRIARIENSADKGPHFHIFAGAVDYAETVIMRSAGR
ncbi:hypothetical protein ACVITL_006757 [Rhizobium pisi]